MKGDILNIIQKDITSVTFAMNRAAARTAEIVKETARQDYLSKKKSDPKLPSLIFNSFELSIPKSTKKEITYKVISGGAKAPYAIYVHNDHKLSNGKLWSQVNPKAPYLFMDVGMEKAEKEVDKIIEEEFSKVMK